MNCLFLALSSESVGTEKIGTFKSSSISFCCSSVMQSKTKRDIDSPLCKQQSRSDSDAHCDASSRRPNRSDLLATNATLGSRRTLSFVSSEQSCDTDNFPAPAGGRSGTMSEQSSSNLMQINFIISRFNTPKQLLSAILSPRRSCIAIAITNPMFQELSLTPTKFTTLRPEVPRNQGLSLPEQSPASRPTTNLLSS